MEVRFLGAHNTESESTRMPGIVIDGIIDIDAGGLTSGLSFDGQLKLKCVLLTHQHYDHLRDIPALAMNLFLRERHIDLYGPPEVGVALKGILNGDNYPDFLSEPRESPTLRFHPVRAGEELTIAGYHVLPVPVCHSVPTFGYQVSRGKSVFYTSDTGPGIDFSMTSSRLIIVEVTSSNRFEDFARRSGHLTPSLLEEELLGFQKLKGYLPRVIAVHINPDLEPEIKKELYKLAEHLGADISLAREGLVVSV